MMNVEMFKHTMKVHQDTQTKLAEALGLEPKTVGRKINETRGASFTVPEMLAIKNRYQLSDDQANAIFFGK